MTKTSPLMTAAEFEELIQRPAGTVKQWVCRKQMPLPYLKIRGRIMLRRETVEAWLLDEIPAYQKPQKVEQQQNAKASGSSTGTGKRRGRPPRVPDLARQQHAQQTM